MHLIVLGLKEHSHRSEAEVLYIGLDRLAANDAPKKAVEAGKKFACFKMVIPEHYFPMAIPVTEQDKTAAKPKTKKA